MSPLTNHFFRSRAGGSTTSLSAVSSSLTTPVDLVANLESIKPLHCDSIPRDIGTPTTADLATPATLHPDKRPPSEARISVMSHAPIGSSPRAIPRAVIFRAGGDSELSLSAKLRDAKTPSFGSPSSLKRESETTNSHVDASTLTIRADEPSFCDHNLLLEQITSISTVR